MKISIEKVNEDLFVLRTDDSNTRYFEALWHIPEGITYNAYLLVSEGRAALFDGWKYTYCAEFLDAVRKVIDPRKIEHIVISHAEPDHTGTLSKILEANGGRAQLYGHHLSGVLLKAFYGIGPNFKKVSDGEEICVGKKRIRFIFTPYLHWPETIMSYIVDDGILLSGDAFGGYSMPPALFDEDEKVTARYLISARKYLANVIGNYRGHIVKNIEKLQNLDLKIETLAPLHGLIWRKNPGMIIDSYLRWAKAEPEKNKIVIIYATMYRYMEKVISLITEELERRGYRSVVFKFTDDSYDDISEAIGEAIDASAIIIGSGTYEADIFPYMRYVIELLGKKINAAKPLLIVSSYGWLSSAGKKASEMFSATNFNVVDSVDFQSSLTEDSIREIKKGLEKLLAASKKT